MALISAKTILTSLSLFHITLGFFFLTSPITIADQALVYIMGEAMGLPHVRDFETQSPALAFLGVILALVGLGDLVTLSQPDEISLVHHWGVQAPLRLMIAFVAVFYSFAFSPSSPLYSSAADPSQTASTSSEKLSSTLHSAFTSRPSSHNPNPAYVPSGWGGDALKNRVFFTFMFVEMVSWFWVWVTLREERDGILEKSRRTRRRSSQGYSNY